MSTSSLSADASLPPTTFTTGTGVTGRSAKHRGDASLNRHPSGTIEHASPPPPPVAPPVPTPATISSAAAAGIGPASGLDRESQRWKGHPGDAANERVVAGSDRNDRTPETLTAAVRRRLVDATADAPAWLISTIIHLILLIILSLVTFELPRGLGTVEVTFGDVDASEATVPLDFALDPAEEETTIDVPEVAEPIEEIEPLAVSPTEVAIELPDLIRDAPEAASMVAADAFADIPRTGSMVAGRTGAVKKALLAAYGGNEETEDAVRRGLRWLARQQKKDGGWSLQGPYDGGAIIEQRESATAMAILAFAGAGYTHLEGEYRQEVKRGLRFLLSRIQRTGAIAGGGSFNSTTYAQAQTLMALSELYAMTGDTSLKDVVQLMVDYAIEAQSPEGGWRYSPRNDSDTSVTGWYVMGLESAHAAGLDVPIYYREGVGVFLNSVSLGEGMAYKYQPLRPSASPAMTAEGLLCRQYLGWPRDITPLQNGVALLIEDHNFDIDEDDLYYWYYATQVMHHYGGSEWRSWNAKMSTQLPARQVRRGRAAGSWSRSIDADHGHLGGRLYATCLSLYCLEVYYRHLPLYTIEP